MYIRWYVDRACTVLSHVVEELDLEKELDCDTLFHKPDSCAFYFFLLGERFGKGV